MIASGSPLKPAFEGIADLVRSRYEHIECSIHPGTPPMKDPAPGIVRRYILAGSSEPVGWLDFNRVLPVSGEDDLERTLGIAIRLASIAIESASVQEKLSYQANYDSLTGLSNRLRFQGSVHRALTEAKKTGEGFAILFIDLDDFKQINDRYGHRIGDLYLKEVSNRFRSCIRKVDTLARLGGDEFAAVVSGANSAGAERIVVALHLSLSKRLIIEEFKFQSSASIGFSLYPGGGTDAESLLRAADDAMYAAKLAGKTTEANGAPESVKDGSPGSRS
jgi:two-component system CheB/CheR fusion protein